MPFTKSADAGNIAGSIHSHQFPAANTALPTANHDASQLAATEDFLTKGAASVDTFAISPEKSGAKSAGEEEIAPAGAPSMPGLQTTFAVGEEAESSIPVNSSPGSATPITLLTAPLSRTSAAVRRGGTPTKKLCRMLYTLCASAGLRFGEALGIDIKSISPDCTTINICQNA